MSDYADKFDDPFAPPKNPCVVCCIHCGSTYDSWRIVWRDMPGEAIQGAWCCPIPGCDGIGFRFDIHPVDANWEDESSVEPPFAAAIEEDEEEWSIENEFDDDDDEDDLSFDDEEDEEAFALPIDEFDADAFWIEPHRITQRRVGNTPQPPFDRAPYGHASSSDNTFKDDDIPF